MRNEVISDVASETSREKSRDSVRKYALPQSVRIV
jgi:hypothetical protein